MPANNLEHPSSTTLGTGPRNRQLQDNLTSPFADPDPASSLSRSTSSAGSSPDRRALMASHELSDIPGGRADTGSVTTGVVKDDATGVTVSGPYRTYKRRWFGLIQLILLNLIVSWDWLTFAAVSDTASKYFSVTENTINWLSTGFLFAFVFASPAAAWALHRGPKTSIIAASTLVFLGNWIRYAGTRRVNFGAVMFGQILIGFGQPFVLSAPTTYSDLWYTDGGRTTATAVATLANPLGAALGQLIVPAFIDDADSGSMHKAVLYVAIISTAASIPSFFIPAKPPTPASASSLIAKTSWRTAVSLLSKNLSFWLVFITFTVYVSFFNALSSLLNQIFGPYGFSEDEAGIGGAILIVVGIIAGCIVSVINDRIHAYVLIIKILVPIVAIAYLALIWMPETRSVGGPYAILALLGAASFSLLPVALEYIVELTFPVGPEMTSVFLWASGQLFGGIFIIIMQELKDSGGDPEGATPPGNMKRALIFEGVVACIAVIFPLALGVKALGLGGDKRARYGIDEREVRVERGSEA